MLTPYHPAVLGILLILTQQVCNIEEVAGSAVDLDILTFSLYMESSKLVNLNFFFLVYLCKLSSVPLSGNITRNSLLAIFVAKIPFVINNQP